MNFIKDDGFKATGYGIAQYFTYVLSPEVTLNARGEVFRDNDGFFVANFPDPLGAVLATKGLPTQILTAPPTTYGSLTLGLTIKPSVPKPLALVMLRPEIRYDRSLSGSTPFDVGRQRDSFLFGGDIVVGF